jgi:hypothetical protein
MKCREVKQALVAYLDGEVMPSERTLVEAHLAGCPECERELSALASSRGTIAGALRTLASEAEPSPQAWAHLESRLTEESRGADPGVATGVTPLLRKGARPMRLRWRIALGTAGAVVLAAAVIAAVPTSRAAAGGFFAGVLHIYQYTPMQASYLPAGFQESPEFSAGSISVGMGPGAAVPGGGAQSGQASDVVETEQALYRNGDQFVLIRTVKKDGTALPEGEKVTVKGEKAVVVTGLSGTFDFAPPADLGGSVNGPTNIQGASGEGVITVTAGGDGQTSTQAAGLPPAVAPLTYQNAVSLAWIVDGTRIEILSNLPLAELLKIAEGLVPGKSSEVED